MEDVLVEACEVSRGDVVVFPGHRRRVLRVDPCPSSFIDLHMVWVESPVPLCIRPSAQVTVRRSPLEVSP